jgi:hypothetical protein
MAALDWTLVLDCQIWVVVVGPFDHRRWAASNVDIGPHTSSINDVVPATDADRPNDGNTNQAISGAPRTFERRRGAALPHPPPLLGAHASLILGCVRPVGGAAARSEGLGPEDSIYRACIMRFHPILMTTMWRCWETRQPLSVRNCRRTGFVSGSHGLHDADRLLASRPAHQTVVANGYEPSALPAC